MDDPRLDKWLWSVRAFKTRPLATEACRSGKVTIGEQDAKPGRAVHVGETIAVREGGLVRTFKVLGLPRSRVAAKLLPEYVQDLTPEADYARDRQAGIERMLARKRGKVRITNKNRDEFSRFFGID